MQLPGISRRRLIKSLGGALAAAPFGRLMQGSIARAATGTAAKRLLLLFTPHGYAAEYWRPKMGASGAFDIEYDKATLAPLAPFRNKIAILDGVDMRVLYETQKTGHTGGMASLWTGSEPLDLGGGDFVGGTPSIDQAVADHFISQGIVTPHRSIELGVGFEMGTNVYTAMNVGSGAGTARRIQGVHDPAVAFTRLFGDATGSDETPEQVAISVARKRSLIDHARTDIQSIRARVGSFEQAKLDAHLDGLRAIETRLDALAGRTCATKVADDGASLDPRAPENVPAILELQTDIIAQAFACDLTRVASLQLYFAGAFVKMPFIGIENDPHTDLAHAIYDGSQSCGGQGLTCNQTVVADYTRMQQWYTTAMAMVLRKLDEIPEENGGSVLDNTLVVWGNELGEPSGHSNVNVPFVLAGGAAGAIQMGRWLQYSQLQSGRCDVSPGTCSTAQAFTVQTPHNALLVSVARAFGIEGDTFGDARYSGGLPGL